MASSYIKFATDTFTAAYPHIHEPDTKSNFPSNAYEVSAYLNAEDHSQTIEAINNAINAAAEAEWPGVTKDNLQTPLKPQEDGTLKVKFKSKDQPSLQDATGKTLPDGVFVTSGDLVRVAGAAKAYSMGGREGITLYLNHLRLVDKRGSLTTSSDPFGGPDDGYQAGEPESEDIVF